MSDSILFQPLKVGSVELKHRVVLAPLTRCRATPSNGYYVPNDLLVEYYSQRATSGGLLISEASPISITACGFAGVPGIWAEDQIAGWKKVTDAVHAKGGYISCQLWHVGRAATALDIQGVQPLSSTSKPLEGASASTGMLYKDFPPRKMVGDDFTNVINDFVQASKNAIAAGFDFVEVHSANGYLLDQFLMDNINTRDDEYGGSIEKRAKFPLQVIKAVVEAVGAEKVGVRFSPYGNFQDCYDSDPNAHWSYVCEQLVKFSSPIAYVHMVDPRSDFVVPEAEKLKNLERQVSIKQQFSLKIFRDILKPSGTKFIAAGAIDRERALSYTKDDVADMIAFGRYFISNPDLVERLRHNWPLTHYERNTFYWAPDPAHGYTDYEFYKST
ncbi:hypothetical protein KL932_004530 [Ogataea haglerorum]|nr:hypothetical protein KL914_004941 [Ogataea haglerorum]KAG7735323.1 hypothetical protein KL932_004530 [Ogataea haglerorum]KAG7754499.1 hypothetical protein KL947_004899 [Ogataea haglerorum]KAG7813079.1 hypothetical protein KL924_001827 [Ogataea haglerorum]